MVHAFSRSCPRQSVVLQSPLVMLTSEPFSSSAACCSRILRIAWGESRMAETWSTKGGPRLMGAVLMEVRV